MDMAILRIVRARLFSSLSRRNLTSVPSSAFALKVRYSISVQLDPARSEYAACVELWMPDAAARQAFQAVMPKDDVWDRLRERGPSFLGSEWVGIAIDWVTGRLAWLLEGMSSWVVGLLGRQWGTAGGRE